MPKHQRLLRALIEGIFCLLLCFALVVALLNIYEADNPFAAICCLILTFLLALTVRVLFRDFKRLTSQAKDVEITDARFNLGNEIGLGLRHFRMNWLKYVILLAAITCLEATRVPARLRKSLAQGYEIWNITHPAMVPLTNTKFFPYDDVVSNDLSSATPMHGACRERQIDKLLKEMRAHECSILLTLDGEVLMWDWQMVQTGTQIGVNLAGATQQMIDRAGAPYALSYSGTLSPAQIVNALFSSASIEDASNGYIEDRFEGLRSKKREVEPSSPRGARDSPKEDPIEGKNQIADALNKWAMALEENDPNEIAASYAPIVRKYFLARNVANSEIRRSRQEYLASGDRVQAFKLTQLDIEQTSKDTADVKLTKAITSVADGREASVIVHSVLSLSKSDGQWKIVAETDLR